MHSPVYLAARPGPRRDALAERLGAPAVTIDDPHGLSLDDLAPGLVLVCRDDVDADALIALAQAVSDEADALRSALAEISKVRHDLNNHLTPALAEVQLLLMDVEGEAREACEVIQEELRTISRIVASTAHLKP
jgi:hypothetical protein